MAKSKYKDYTIKLSPEVPVFVVKVRAKSMAQAKSEAYDLAFDRYTDDDYYNAGDVELKIVSSVEAKGNLKDLDINREEEDIEDATIFH